MKLLPAPVAPKGWKEGIAQKRGQRYMERDFKLRWGLDWTRPSDPLGLWVVFIRILVSSTKMVDAQGSLVFDRRTRRPRMVYEYGFLPLVVDLEQSVDSLHRRIQESNVPALKHQSFTLELDGHLLQGNLDHYNIYDDAVIFCNILDKRR